jgi:hypothetical protein
MYVHRLFSLLNIPGDLMLGVVVMASVAEVEPITGSHGIA